MKYRLILAALGLFLSVSCEYNSIGEPARCNTNDLALRVTENKEASCGQSDGSLKVVASGGSTTYSFSINGGTFQSDSAFQNLKAGSYIIIVKDHSCTASVDVDIQNQNGLNISATSTDASCGTTSGSITVTTLGGVSPVIFNLSPGSLTSSSSIFENLASGNYTVLAKDATGCEVVSKTIKVASGISFTNSISTIIAGKCAVTGCHNGTQSPDFRVFQNIQNNATSIKLQTTNRNMPLGGSLTKDQIDAIACWVNDGAPNN